MKTNTHTLIRQVFYTALPVFVVLLLCWPCTVYAEETEAITKQTFIYAIKGADTLRLDKYDMTAATNTNKPCLIFVFGGGFAAGKRDAAHYVAFYKQLLQHGYTVVAIDYRLGMRDVRNKLNTNQSKLKLLYQFIGIFEQSIAMAVEDLFDATNYVINMSESWHIDTKQIVACGSSAGAITVLQGEYERCNSGKSAKRLPEEFSYAGVISFAGAIFNTTNGLQWAKKPAPLQLFHGDMDKEVPYDYIKFRKLGFYGSFHIAKQLKEIRSPYYFYSVKNTGHEMANNPMNKNWDEIHTFLQKFVTDKENLIIDAGVEPMDKPGIKKKLKFKDFIGSFKL